MRKLTIGILTIVLIVEINEFRLNRGGEFTLYYRIHVLKRMFYTNSYKAAQVSLHKPVSSTN